MIWFLRNISVHLWVSVLITIPTCFLVLPVLIRLFPNIDPMMVGAGMMIGSVVTIGFIMNFLARKLIKSLLKEGQTWERAGIVQKAEKRYIRAIRLFDSFLLWPLGSRKMARNIAEAVSRFQLNTGVVNENFSSATSFYLKLNPEDVEISRLWLRRLRQSNIISSREQDVLSLLAETHERDLHLSRSIADIFLGLERRDFTAQKLYDQLQKEPDQDDAFVKKVEDLVGKPEEETLGRGLVFHECEPEPVHEPEPERPPEALSAPRTAGFKTQVKQLLTTRKPVLRLNQLYAGLMAALKWGYRTIGALLGSTALVIFKMAGYIRDREKVRFYIKTACIGLLSVWLVFLAIATVRHLFQASPIEKEAPVIIEQVPKPFTIQVASYLKQTHADRYLAVLKKKGLDASVKKVVGGGKTWFVVRVSEFEDKKSAAEYGRDLKQKGVIDDFFVNNK